MSEVAQDERNGLGLSDHEPLDPYALAHEHGIPVYTLAELRDNGLDPAALNHFHHMGHSSWSAALIPLGPARVIVENEAHALVRRRSNIAHELGHHLLEHSFENVILGEDHKRQFNVRQESEAKFISGQLLIPDKAARRAAYNDWDNARVALAFDVSEQFAQMRMVGARVIAARAAKKFGIAQ